MFENGAILDIYFLVDRRKCIRGGEGVEGKTTTTKWYLLNVYFVYTKENISDNCIEY